MKPPDTQAVGETNKLIMAELQALGEDITGINREMKAHLAEINAIFDRIDSHFCDTSLALTDALAR